MINFNQFFIYNKKIEYINLYIINYYNMQNNTDIEKDHKVVEHLLNFGNIKTFIDDNEYESDSSIEDKPVNKNELFHKIFTIWSKKNYETFVSSDMHSIATDVFSSHFNKTLKFGQVTHHLRGFYNYISKLDSTKFPKVKIIKESNSYSNSMKLFTPDRKPKVIIPRAPKRKNIKNDDSSDDSDDEMIELPVIKRKKFDVTSSPDIINQIKKLSFNVFIMLNELGAINLKGEFIKKVKLDITKVKEIGNINTIMQLVELNIIEPSSA